MECNSEPLTREMMDRAKEIMRKRHDAYMEYRMSGGKPFLTPTQQILDLARSLGIDLTESFNLQIPLTYSELMEDNPLDDGIIS